MKPAPGRYRLTTTQPATNAVVVITEGGMFTTFGYLEWVEEPPAPGAFVCGAQTVTFTTDTDFLSNNGASWYAGKYAPI